MGVCRSKLTSGFTLAEVLITLAIVGVVAALTVPSIIKDHQNKQMIVKLKKVYTTFSQTTLLAVADYGAVETWQINDTSSGGVREASIKFAETYLIPYFRVDKSHCYNDGTTTGCVYKYSQMNGEGPVQSANHAKFYLTDGTLVLVSVSNYVSTSGADQGLKRCAATISFDINGAKKPNITGKDLFNLTYLIDDKYSGGSGEMKLQGPELSTCINDNYGCNTGGSGTYCGRAIQLSSWQIPDKSLWNDQSKYPY